LRFGKSADEAATEPSRGGGSGDFIRYLKDGDTTFRILQEPDDWKYWWEHFSPSGFSFPCPREATDPVEDCPGCSSDNEKMSKVNRKIGFNVLNSFQGQEYVNAFKVGPTVADKLKNRFARFATVTDRDYTITRYKTSGDRYDFDVEGGTVTPIDLSKYELKDIEAMLAQSYDEAWGDPAQAQANLQATQVATQERETVAKVKRATIAPQPAAVASEEPPFEEEKVYQEADLRAMEYEDLLVVIKRDMQGAEPPSSLTTTGEVVDWLMSLQ
jgi:hypothetical protein